MNVHDALLIMKTGKSVQSKEWCGNFYLSGDVVTFSCPSDSEEYTCCFNQFSVNYFIEHYHDDDFYV
jgi:hypothetical protein